MEMAERNMSWKKSPYRRSFLRLNFFYRIVSKSIYCQVWMPFVLCIPDVSEENQFVNFSIMLTLSFYVCKCSSSGVSNTRPARCVCAARKIIKITQIIAKLLFFVV